MLSVARAGAVDAAAVRDLSVGAAALADACAALRAAADAAASGWAELCGQPASPVSLFLFVLKRNWLIPTAFLGDF